MLQNSSPLSERLAGIFRLENVFKVIYPNHSPSVYEQRSGKRKKNRFFSCRENVQSAKDERRQAKIICKFYIQHRTGSSRPTAAIRGCCWGENSTFYGISADIPVLSKQMKEHQLLFPEQSLHPETQLSQTPGSPDVICQWFVLLCQFVGRQISNNPPRVLLHL